MHSPQLRTPSSQQPLAVLQRDPKGSAMMSVGSPAQDRSDAQPEKCPLARARAWPPMATSAGPSDALLEPTPASQLPRDRGGRPTPLTAGAHSPTPAHAQSESSPSSPPAGTPRSGCGSDAPGGGQARVLTPLSSSHGNFRDGAPASPSGDGHADGGRARKRRAAAAGGGGPLPKRQALSKGESKGRTAKRTAAEKRMAHDFIKCFLISGGT